LPQEEKRAVIDDRDEVLSVRRQCEILEYNRSNLYYSSHPRDYHSQEFREKVMAGIDYWNTKMPAWGAKKIIPLLREDGINASKELVRELMGEMGIITIYPHINTSKAAQNARKMPYLLKNKCIFLPNQVWATDITYIKMGKSHMFLSAIIDWFSRFIIGWTLWDTLETEPIIYALENAFKQYGFPAIVNSDQGSQYTSDYYKDFLSKNCIMQSMDGKGKWADNVIIERWFRNLKIEEIYISQYENPKTLRAGIAEYISLYNNIRPHQSLAYLTPQKVWASAF